ncbi:PilZ domain-containing protein [Devosia sp. 63-57]|uniref:PilZ domain-containing protein n=1 Tax=Devosia sp. 63-57 TaxID=1895751 RepID=UPI00086F6249|nr:PilZ domain-containing protein [Devosia sp. 63-57]ODT49828.1 MAG: pilus assembly protein PilZ [Pelagibacterium sp. SCN 63-126]ODU86261.1 MAG: pilus assembly protein PilZ [Pelagibacterium sp. SCN 63-17]OJX45203.1 MAG: pilus assembly protein PilZ [Devosia sp. 63-57]
MLSDDISSPDIVAVRPRANDERFQRVKVSILGRYMLADRREFPCQVLSMSPGDAVVIAPVSGINGERVIAYLDHIGRIEGTIIGQIDGGFVMDIAASPRKRDKMAAQLTWLANKDLLNLPEDRRHERVVPDIRHSTIVLDDGRRYNCKIIDISLSGAAIELDVRPAMGTPVTLGRMRARVVRHFQNGVAVEFAASQEMLTVVQQNLRMN